MCYRPIFLLKKAGVSCPAYEVPCGKCLSCIRKASFQWSERMIMEARYCGFDNCCFLTLTYDDDVLEKRNEVLNLSKVHMQKFFKRLRKRLRKDGIFVRYFYCGEYGDKTFRPHYHLLLFGVSVDHPIFFDDVRRVVTKKGWSLRLKSWKYGFVHLSFSVGQGTFYYVCQYMMNDTPERRKMLKAMGLAPEFRLMSRNPGLGRFELEKNLLRYMEKPVTVRKIDDLHREIIWHSRYVEGVLYPEGIFFDERKILKDSVKNDLLLSDLQLADERGMLYGDFIREMRHQEECNLKGKKK